MMTEVVLDLLKRTAARLGDEFVDKAETKKADRRENEERGRKTEGIKKRREDRTDAEVREPEAENGTAHAHAADAQREELRQQQPGYRGKEALLEEQERDCQGKNDEWQDGRAGEKI